MSVTVTNAALAQMFPSRQARMRNLNVTGCFVSYKRKIPKIAIILEFYRVGTKTRNELQ